MEDTIMSMEWPKWAGVVAAVVLFFDRLAKLTATKKDDRVVNWLHRLLSLLAADVPEATSSPRGRKASASGSTSPEGQPQPRRRPEQEA